MDKFVIISNSVTLNGFEFSGLCNEKSNILVQVPLDIERDAFINMLKEILKNKDLEIVFISEPFYDLVSDELLQMKESNISFCSIPIRY